MSQTSTIRRQARESLTSAGSFVEVRGSSIAIPRSSYSSSSDSDEIVEIPAILESQATLQWLGFTEGKSQLMMSSWAQAYATDNEADFFETIEATINQGSDAVDLTDDWPAAIRSMGMTRAFRKKIMHHRYNHIRLSETAKFWVLDTVTDKYRFLSGLSNTLLGRGIKQTGFVSLQSRLANKAEASQWKKSSKESQRDQTSRPLVVASTTDEMYAQEEEIVMYKGGKMSRLRNAISEEQAAKDVHLQALASTPPTDFERAGFSLYFTKEKVLAEEFVGYAAERLDGGKWVELGMLSVALPTKVLASMVEIYESDWKQFVWKMRLQDYHNFPAHLDHYDRANILFGGMLQISTAKVHRIKESGGDYTQLEGCKLSDGTRGSQYCFKNAIMVADEINKVARVWIETRGK